MTRPQMCASGKVVGILWRALAVALLTGFLFVSASVEGAEYPRRVYAATPSIYSQDASVPRHSAPATAPPVQRIPAYPTAVPANGLRRAAFTDSGTGETEPILQAYPCTSTQGAVLDAALNEQFGSRGNVRIVHDPTTKQLLVMAPEALQRQIAPQIRAVTAVATTEPRAIPQQAESSTSVPAAANVQRKEYQLKYMTAERLESVLQVALGERWTQVAQPAGGVAAFRLAVADQPDFTVRLDHSRNRVLLEGPNVAAYESCVKLIEAVDAPKPTNEHSRCLLPVTSLKTNDLAEVVDAIQASSGPAAPRKSKVGPSVLLAQAEKPAAPPASQGAAGEGGEVTAAVPFPGGGEGGGGEAGLIGPVQIENLEGLDVLVVRGDKRDVQKVVELIQQIEKMSQITEPTIVVHHLNHVDCEALAELVTGLYSEVFSTRQGTVSITALVKPNALLLVGRPESVDTVVSLVKQLDRPVPPESQFKVFRLRHAAAATAQETIDEFFQDAEGEQLAALGARVHVIADFRSNSLIVRASPRDMLEVARMIEEIDTREPGSINDLRVFKLKNSLAEDLEPILQNAIAGQGRTGQTQQNAEQKSVGLRFVTIDPSGQKLLSSGILTDVRVTADPRANALMISAPSESMPLIEALIDQLDQLPAVQAQVKVFTIIKGDAAALVDMLESLFGTTTTNQSEPPVRTGASDGDSSLVSLRFATDVRSNSIIATGSVGDLAVVEAILLRLDENDVKKRKTVVYRLKNAPAPDVADAINEYLENERDVRTGQEDLFSPFEILEQEVIVVAEDISNSLIVSATPEYYDEIADLVEQLDERPGMVMIQVLIAEVRLNDTEEFGVELGLQDSILFDRSLLSELLTVSQTSTQAGLPQVTTQQIVGASNEPGFLFNDATSPLGNSGASNATANANVVGTQGLSNFAVGRINNELGFGGLVLSASSESVSLLLRALKEDRRINVLSRPQIMTMDNQPALIQVGEQVPVVRGTETNASGGITNSVDFEDVGLIVGVTPRITPDGLVVMEIDATKSEVGPEAEGIPIAVQEGVTIRSPRIKTITAQTTVSALDGQTIVLGGLITTDKTKVDRRVPWLCEIPILGQLFRYQGFTSERNELLIVMTPRVVSNEQEAEIVKQAEAARMSWCLNDVLKLHEDIAFRPRSGEWGDDETTTIYPDGKDQPEAMEPTRYRPPEPKTAPVPAAPKSSLPPTPSASPLGKTGWESYRRPRTEPSASGYVAPASYQSTSVPGTGSRNAVYPATGAYGSAAPGYPAAPSYQSTGY